MTSPNINPASGCLILPKARADAARTVSSGSLQSASIRGQTGTVWPNCPRDQAAASLISQLWFWSRKREISILIDFCCLHFPSARTSDCRTVKSVSLWRALRRSGASVCSLNSPKAWAAAARTSQYSSWSAWVKTGAFMQSLSVASISMDFTRTSSVCLAICSQVKSRRLSVEWGEVFPYIYCSQRSPDSLERPFSPREGTEKSISSVLGVRLPWVSRREGKSGLNPGISVNKEDILSREYAFRGFGSSWALFLIFRGFHVILLAPFSRSFRENLTELLPSLM